MTALTENVSRPKKTPPSGLQFRVLPMAGYTNFAGGNAVNTIYKGSVVICDVSDTDGYFKSPSTNDAATDDVIGGIAIEKQVADSHKLEDGKVKVTVAIDGVWAFAKGSLAITDIGAPAYASDDNTITTTSTTAFWIGTIVTVDDDYVWVDIVQACGQLNVFPT